MEAEIQAIKIIAMAGVSAFGVFKAKDAVDKYLELKVLSTMPESYWTTQQKEAEMELKKVEVQEAEETKRAKDELAYRKEKDEKDREHQLCVMDKEKEYPDSYWIYKTEEVKTKTQAKTEAKRQDASVERQKHIWNALSTGFDLFTRRYTWAR